MEHSTFDRIVGRLGAEPSRRRVLGGLLGVAAAALAGGAGLEARTKSASRKRKKHPGHGPGAATDLVAICHVTSDPGRVERLRVKRRALRSHLAHGDFRFRDCCVTADCEAPACFSALCAHGACVQIQLPQGTSCELPWPLGGIGGCTAGGQCVPALTTGG
jgi:hypothetical protein